MVINFLVSKSNDQLYKSLSISIDSLLLFEIYFPKRFYKFEKYNICNAYLIVYHTKFCQRLETYPKRLFWYLEVNYSQMMAIDVVCNWNQLIFTKVLRLKTWLMFLQRNILFRKFTYWIENDFLRISLHVGRREMVV